MQGSDCSSWGWNTGKGRGGLGLRANSAFGNNIFMGCGRTCFVPAVMEPGLGLGMENGPYRKSALFIHVWAVRGRWENISSAPGTSPIYWTLKFGVRRRKVPVKRRRKVPVKRCLPSSVGLSLCPLFHVQPCNKMFVFFSPAGMQMLSWLFLFI